MTVISSKLEMTVGRQTATEQKTLNALQAGPIPNPFSDWPTIDLPGSVNHD